MSAASIRSKGGGYLKLPVPDRDQVCIEDVAHALSHICRCNGHTTPFFSVLQHSLEVSSLCRDHAHRYGLDSNRAGLAGLLHDAPEYAVGDVISPMKRRLGPVFRDLYNEVERNVYSALGVEDVMEECDEIVRWADNEMLISDMVRWRVYGTIVNARGESYRIPEDGSLPEGFCVYFPNAVPLLAGCGREAFISTYNHLKESL